MEPGLSEASRLGIKCQNLTNEPTLSEMHNHDEWKTLPQLKQVNEIIVNEN